MSYRIIAWKRATGKVIGRASIELDNGLVIHEIAVMNSKNGIVALLPSRSWESREGKKIYTQLVEFSDKSKGVAFSNSLVSALRQRDPGAFEEIQGMVA